MRRAALQPLALADRWHPAPAANHTIHTSEQSAICKARDSPSAIDASRHDARTTRADGSASSHRPLVRCSRHQDLRSIYATTTVPVQTTRRDKLQPAMTTTTTPEGPGDGS